MTAHPQHLAPCLAYRRPSVNIWMNTEVEMLKGLASKCLHNQRDTTTSCIWGVGGKRQEGHAWIFSGAFNTHSCSHTYTLQIGKVVWAHGEGDISPYSSWVLWAGQIIKLTQSRRAGEREKKQFNLYVWRFHRNRAPGMTKADCVYIIFRQGNNFFVKIKQGALCLG